MFRDAEKILRDVAMSYSISVDELRGVSRTKTVAHARKKAMYLLRKSLGLSYREIGIVVGGRKSSTVIRDIKNYID